MVPVLLALRFLLELFLLAAFAVIGWSAFDSPFVSVIAAIALPVVVAIAWGILLSPRRRIDLPLALRVVIELMLFGAAAVGLWATGLPALAIGLMTAELVVLVALALAGQAPGADVAGAGSSPDDDHPVTS